MSDKKKTYAELLAEAKGGPRPSEQQILIWKMSAAQICNQLGADLSGVDLTDQQLVKDIVEAKMAEANVFHQKVTVSHGNPPTGAIVEPLAEVILGNYGTAAFTLYVVAVGTRIHAWISQVPQGGNYRGA